MTGHSWAWTAGTGGKTLTGPVVLADLSTPDSLAVYKRQVRGRLGATAALVSDLEPGRPRR